MLNVALLAKVMTKAAEEVPGIVASKAGVKYAGALTLPPLPLSKVAYRL